MAEQRQDHEHETNDFKEFLDNFKDFWEKYGNKILIVLIVGLGTWVGIAKYKEWKAGKQEDAYAALAGAGSADVMLTVAGDHELIHDEAMRRHADMLLGQARTAKINGTIDEQALTTAASAYTALAERGMTPEYKLVGYWGLAQIAEIREQWDPARTHYQKLIEVAGDRFIEQARDAQVAIDMLPQLQNTPGFSEPQPQMQMPEDMDIEAVLDGQSFGPANNPPDSIRAVDDADPEPGAGAIRDGLDDLPSIEDLDPDAPAPQVPEQTPSDLPATPDATEPAPSE